MAGLLRSPSTDLPTPLVYFTRQGPGIATAQRSEPLAITKGSAQVAQVLLVARPCDVNRKLPLMEVEVLLWIMVDVGQAHCRLEEGIPFSWVSHFPFHVVLGLSVQMALQRGDYGVELLSHPLIPKDARSEERRVGKECR